MALLLAIVSVLSTVANLRLDQAQLVAEQQHQKPHFRRCGFCDRYFIAFSRCFELVLLMDRMIWAICSGILANTLIQSLYNYKFSVHAEYFCAGLNIFRSLVVVVVQLSFTFMDEY